MKRNMNMVRRIALWATDEYDKLEDVTVENLDEFHYHVGLMVEGGLLTAVEISEPGTRHWVDINATWAGHEFADKARDDEIWERAKTRIQQAGLESVPISSWEDLLREELYIRLINERRKGEG